MATVLQTPAGWPAILLDRAARGDVHDRDQDEQTAWRAHRIQPDLDREFGAVAAEREQLAPHPHRTALRVAQECAAVSRVARAEALRHQDLDGTTGELVTRPAEQALRLAICEHHRPCLIDREHARRREIERGVCEVVGIEWRDRRRHPCSWKASGWLTPVAWSPGAQS